MIIDSLVKERVNTAFMTKTKFITDSKILTVEVVVDS